jgi:hypothetical protein
MARDNNNLYDEAMKRAVFDADPKQAKIRIGNEAVFSLCQRLKGIAQNGIPAADMEPYLKLWLKTYRQDLTDDDFTLWLQFTELWDGDKIKFPKRDTFNTALARASDPQGELRPELGNMPGEIRRLGAVCYELQKLAGNRPFFISGGQAGQVIGKSEDTGRLALKYLIRHKIIELKQRGHSKRATEYLYIAANPLQDEKYRDRKVELKQQAELLKKMG